MTNTSFEHGLAKRRAFWEKWLDPDSNHSAFRETRMQPDRELPYWAKAVLPKQIQRPRILDVNAGPVSSLGTRLNGKEVDLIPIDDLAHQFDQLIARHGYTVPLRTQFCSAEDILCRFGAGAFDLIYSYNGLANTRDPIRVYAQLLASLKPNRKVITFHQAVPSPSELWKQGFQHFHMIEQGRLKIVHKSYVRDLQDALPQARIRATESNGIIKLELSVAKSTSRKQSKCPRIADGQKLPRLISIHIPKTAGSSFRRFLEQTYGPSLRCLYSEEETAPRLIPGVRIEKRIRCLHGHFQGNAYTDRYPRAKKITWLRDPVERVVSSYYQYHRWPPKPDGSPFLKGLFEQGWRILDFARRDEMIQQVRWYLDGIPLDQFFFVGITEHYAASLQLLCHQLRIDHPDGLQIQNINPDRKQAAVYNLPNAIRQEIAALYADEFAIYERARKRLNEYLISTFGASAGIL
jgi:hypothetical protein